MSNPTCTVPDCDKPARSATATLCPMHYHRWYRHGNVDKVRTGNKVSVKKYRTVYAKGHPVAAKNDKAYEHRVVLYDSIGGGPHPCAWCGTELHWLPTAGQEGLEVDHLDGVRDNNSLENLVPSCRRCNSGRGIAGHRARLLAEGFWSRHDTVGAMGERSTDLRDFVIVDHAG